MGRFTNAASRFAHRLPERIKHLVYLDAAMLENGQSVFSMLPPDVVAARAKAAQETERGLEHSAAARRRIRLERPGAAGLAHGAAERLTDMLDAESV